MSKAVISYPDDIRNAKGELGAICNKCSGFGFTYSLAGEHLDCKDCHETGVGIDLIDLQNQVVKLTRLVNMLYNELKNEGRTNIT